MKQIIFNLLLAGAFALFIQSCHQAPYYKNGYLRSSEVQRRITNGIAGIYQGKLDILYEPQGDKGYRKTMVDYEYTMGGYGDQHIVLHSFPISMVSKTIVDSKLSRAMEQTPNYDVLLKYRVEPADEDGDDKKAVVCLDAVPVLFTLNYGGKSHHVKIIFESDMRLGGIHAEQENTWCINHVQFSVKSITVDNEVVQKYNVWSEPSSMFIVLLKGNKK